MQTCFPSVADVSCPMLAVGCGGLWLTCLLIHKALPPSFRPLMLFFWFFCGACVLLFYRASHKIEINEVPVACLGYLKDKPKEKNKTWACRVRVDCMADTQQTCALHEDVLLYVQKDSASARLRRGDGIRWTGILKTLRPSVSLSGFDYSEYLRSQGIQATAYLSSGTWQTDSCWKQDMTWYEAFHKRLQQHLEKYFPDVETRAGLSALTLGDKGELGTDQKALFANVGASHLLALSGLHLGFICAFLEFMLSFLWSYRARQYKCLLIIVSLWLFTFFVGAPASLLRASVMFSMMYLSRLAGRDYFSMNALAWAAFVMLLWNPTLLFDLGFQLSFAAVWGIGTLVPIVQNLYQPRNKLIRYFWNVSVVSAAAQIGVLPVALYHFGTQPVYFLLTNIVAIPLIAVILFFAILFLGLLWWPWAAGLLADLLHLLWSGLQQFLHKVLQMPHPVFHWQLDAVEAVILGIIIICLSHAMRERNRWIGILGVGFCFLFSGYHLSAGSPLLYRPMLSLGAYEGDRTYIQWRLSRREVYQWKVGEEPSVDSPFISQQGIVSWGGINLCVLADDEWNTYIGHSEPYPIDYLYVTKAFKGSLSELQQLFAIRQVVLDASIGSFQERKWKEACVAAHIPLTLLSEKGFIQIDL